jgi:hypothetical protein
MKSVFLAAVLCAAVLCGQDPLVINTSNMKVSVTMDREAYLPGEVAQITLTVTNPTSTAVVSLTPFLDSNSCFGSFRKDQPEQEKDLLCSSREETDRPITTTFAPGESRQMTLNSYDRQFGIGPSVLVSRSVPTHPGLYTFVFQYAFAVRAQAEYTVEAAKLEADSVARVHDLMFSDQPKLVPPRPYPTYVHVLALRSNGQTYICVSQGAVNRRGFVVGKVDVRDNLDFDDSHVDTLLVSPFKRVATSPSSVVSLSATADADENLTIEWADADGGKGHLNHPASYPALPRK